LKALHHYAETIHSQPGHVDVLYHFMNTVAVQFSADAEKGYKQLDARSTLSHALEKAAEAYFGLYRLLLCIATEEQAVVDNANRIDASFITGPRTKAPFPDPPP
jgi:hypothetical protein